MLFGTWSQAHAYDPSDYMETRLYFLAACVVRLENTSLPRNRFTLNKMMVTGVKGSWNRQVAITICNSYRVRTNRTNNGDNYILR